MDNKRFSAACLPLPKELRIPILRHEERLSKTAQEITLRLNRPLSIQTADTRCYITGDGTLTDISSSASMLTADKDNMQEFFENICEYSVYSRQHEINNGYITINGGHRVGICGTAVTNDGKITNIKNITGMNIRISREMRGCSDTLRQRIDPDRGVLLCGPPSSGKTTLIRDLARSLSYQRKVSVIDERNELSAGISGVFQNDMGMCDVYVGYPKSDGMIHAVRSMSPDIIVCDELGDESDEQALMYSSNCGCSMIATVHCGSIESLRRKPLYRRMLKAGVFGYIVFLYGRKKAGEIAEIYSTDELC